MTSLPPRGCLLWIAAAESSRWWLEKSMTAASREDRAIAMDVYTHKNWAFFKAG